MKRFQAIVSFLLFAVFASAIASELQASTGLSPLISVTGFTAFVVLGTIRAKRTPGVYANAVTVELWVAYIMKRFWKDNTFLKYFYDDGQYIVNGSIVHIPQPGAKPVVRKNRATFPGTAVRRADTDIVYVMDEYSTDPTHIQDAEEVEVSYDKMDSILTDHQGALNEDMADDFLIKILDGLPEANIVYTTGELVDAKVAGQTGQRRVAVPKDLKRAKLKMDKANVPKKDRYALLDADMMDEITDVLSESQMNAFRSIYDPEKGILGFYEGFTILDRSFVGVANGALNGSSELVMNALGAAVAADDDVVSICWQKDAAAKAISEPKFFENKQDALFYGDVYSALMRMGGRRRRDDSAGVICIKQAAA